MANTKSAKKAIRVSARKKKVNTEIKRSYRTARSQVVKAVSANEKAEAEKLLVEAYSKIDTAAKKGTLHRNTANRYKSRLAQQVNGLKKNKI